MFFFFFFFFFSGTDFHHANIMPNEFETIGAPKDAFTIFHQNVAELIRRIYLPASITFSTDATSSGVDAEGKRSVKQAFDVWQRKS